MNPRHPGFRAARHRAHCASMEMTSPAGPSSYQRIRKCHRSKPLVDQSSRTVPPRDNAVGRVRGNLRSADTRSRRARFGPVQRLVRLRLDRPVALTGYARRRRGNAAACSGNGAPVPRSCGYRLRTDAGHRHNRTTDSSSIPHGAGRADFGSAAKHSSDTSKEASSTVLRNALANSASQMTPRMWKSAKRRIIRSASASSIMGPRIESDLRTARRTTSAPRPAENQTIVLPECASVGQSRRRVGVPSAHFKPEPDARRRGHASTRTISSSSVIRASGSSNRLAALGLALMWSASA